MDDSGNLESKISKEMKPEAQDSKKRKKMDERVVVEVKLEESEGPPPSDSWSWRKYGQKPIKGSPYPRGYYRCSTSKGCSAKKQVERCRTDGSILIITYTSSHNHAGPTLHASTNQNQDLITEQPPSQTQDQEQEQEQEEQEIIMDKQMNTFTEKENLENPYDYEEPVSNSDPMNLSASKSEENDFFDELEELPVSSFLTDFSTLFEERILVNLS